MGLPLLHAVAVSGMYLCKAGGDIRTPKGQALVSLSGTYTLRFLEAG